MCQLLKIKVSGISDIHEINSKLRNYNFRGQKNYLWPLIPSFERKVNLIDNIDSLYLIEKISIQDFKAKAFTFLNHLPKNKNYFAWLTIMQHYGGSTRLLDFTRSIYISLYFAIEETFTNNKGDPSPVIWAINKNKVMNKYFENSSWKILEEKYDIRKNQFNDLKLLKRYKAQQGVLYTVLNKKKQFDHQLSNIFGINYKELYDDSNEYNYKDSLVLLKKEPPIIRITFDDFYEPYSYYESLKKMNITTASLFPGLEGYAKSMNYFFNQNFSKKSR